MISPSACNFPYDFSSILLDNLAAFVVDNDGDWMGLIGVCELSEVGYSHEGKGKAVNQDKTRLELGSSCRTAGLS
jgi:hypothetical protein